MKSAKVSKTFTSKIDCEDLGAMACPAETGLDLLGFARGATEALTSSREAAYSPLVRQEIANRENAVNQYANLGGLEGNLANEQNEFTQTALGAQGQEQQTRQAQYDAAYQDLLRRFGLQQQTAL